MLEIKNAKYANSENTIVDVEINHPAHGWIPYTFNFLEEDTSFDANIREWILSGATVSVYTLSTEDAVAHFKSFTNRYIQARIDKWNEDNKATGIRFDDIHSFPKYAVLPTDTRHDISVQFLTWNGAIWDTATAYMLSATTVPTEAEFQAILDAVGF